MGFPSYSWDGTSKCISCAESDRSVQKYYTFCIENNPHLLEQKVSVSARFVRFLLESAFPEPDRTNMPKIHIQCIWNNPDLPEQKVFVLSVFVSFCSNVHFLARIGQKCLKYYTFCIGNNPHLFDQKVPIFAQKYISIANRQEILKTHTKHIGYFASSWGPRQKYRKYRKRVPGR